MRDIAVNVPSVSSNETGANIFALFQENTELSEIPVVDAHNRPVGIIGRWTFLLRVGHRFGYEIFANRSISLLMDRNPILVDADEFVSDFVDTILNTHLLNQLTGFIITKNQEYYGVGSTFNLTKALHAQAVDTIKELRQTAGELRQANKIILRDKLFISTIIDNIPTAIQVRDVNTGDTIIHNRAAEEVGLSSQSFILNALDDTLPDVSVSQADDTTWHARIGKSEQTLTDRQGIERILSKRNLLIDDDDGNRRWELCVADDITEYREAQRSIEQLAHYDNLTGLPNRNYFSSKLNAMADQQEFEFFLLYIDLDHFKSINDVHGHSGGDELLRKAASRLQACCRQDDFVARLGGDEFAMIWPYCSATAPIEPRLGELIKLLSAPYTVQDNEVVVGASIGAAHFPDQANDSATLLRYADMALYKAKALGRCQYKLFDNALSREMSERAELVAALHKMVDGEGLSLHYQPIYCLTTNKIRSFEALARWHHAERGTIPPDIFIRLVEDTGLIHQFGERVLRMACYEARTWPKTVTVSVNVSPLQLKRRQFPDVIRTILEETGLEPSRLDLEITESVLMDEYEYKNSILNDIREIGCNISIDDFGTGYSSLSYLWKLPFDKIKIDRSFVQALPDPTAKEIIQSIVGIASIRAKTVIVEGVESQIQLDAVRAMKCTEAQGYFLGRPGPCPLAFGDA
ncbi:EAL domain-containing protein [Acetobacter sp. TBRC 12305]|uniref:EAL domain-containing protein n=1 Tax=Acetobacter garciniae TaxID=2817435 RepID=A0A939HP45_9PROT|nr:EAL domain-containing protein [Acetobacter garciniae]MBO1324616.1 EAL domain-containing protein [Acetobacter garciniae]MBX0344305.1 EAL domain-containing protein [Acetobacter garciniae]